MEPADPSFSLLTFWRRWPAAVRPLLLLAALTFTVALLASVAAFVTGDDAVRPWTTPSELTAVNVPIDTVRVGTMALPVLAPAQLVSQLLAPAPPGVALGAASWMLALLAIVIIGYLAVLPGLGWRTFLVAAGGLTFFLSTFSFDLLGLFSLPGVAPNSLLAQAATGLAVLLLVGPAWALHAFYPQVGPTRRLLLFGGLVLGIGALVFWRSPLPAGPTALHLVSYAMAGALGACVLVISWVSYENVRALLWFTGQADMPARRRGLAAFALATGFYLLNLLLLFLDAFGFVEFGGAFLNAFFVLLSSIISGLFGLRLREVEYGRAVPYLLMLPLYLLLSALTLGTLAYAFATANGSLVEAFTDGVVATHLVAGFVFFVYVIFNFASLIQRRLRVYRVVFEPKRLPLIMMYAIMAVGLVSILLRQQFFLNRQLQGGYYNGLGDLYRACGEGALADVTYARADRYVPFDEKANTSRAALARERLELRTEQNLLRRALRRTPSEKTYADLAATYAPSETSFFEHSQVLHDARRTFPKSPVPPLLLGALYGRTTLADSVNHYFSRAARQATRPVRGPLFVNELAWLVRQRDDAAARQLARQTSPADPVGAQANAALVGLLTGPRLPALPFLGAVPDSLTAETFAWLTQRGLRQLRAADTTAVPVLTALASRPANALWAPALLELRALTWRASQPARARAALLERAEGGEGEIAGRRFRTLGQWALADNQPVAAAEFFARAANQGDQPAYLYRVVALALAGETDSARAAIPLIFASGDRTLTAPARRLLVVLSAPVAAMIDDSLKTDYVVLHATARRGLRGPAPVLDSLAATIRRPALRALAAAALADRALAVGDAGRAWRLTGLAPAEPTLRWLRAEAALRVGKTAETARLLALPLPGASPAAGPAPAPAIRAAASVGLVDARAVAWHQYLTGALAASRGQTRAATAAFAPLAARAPWLERGLLAAGAFFTEYPPRAEPLTAYNTLLAGVRYHERAPALWEAYALSAIRAGLVEFADAAREHLRALLPPAEFATFDARYATALTDARQATAGFE